MADLVKAIQPPLHLAAIADIAKAMQPPAHLTAVSQMMTAMQREHRLFAELARPPRFLDDLTKEIAQMRAFSASITAPYHAIQEIIRSQSAVFERLSAQVAAFNAIKFSIPQFSQATLALNVASIRLANRMNDIGLLARREMLSARLFEAPIAYTAFVRHTTERLGADPAPDIAARLRGSLNLAAQQLLDIADTVSGFIEVPDDEEEPDDKRMLNAPFTQQDELLAYDAIEDETDTEAMTIISPTAQTVQCGRRVLELVTQCNEAGKTSAYGVEIFKPTTRLMAVFNDLPWLSPTDRSRFADVVDCLYFIFYEGAGKDNLRFLDKHGGPLTEADCDLIWCIKHLRNKWFRHDADHGKEKDIQKSWAELAAKFHWLGLAEHPTDGRHFQQLHYQLLVLAEDFLARILSKLKLKQ
ncbi:MAG: hypothetical protein ABIC39_01900 [Pseudomonadota bacterium]